MFVLFELLKGTADDEIDRIGKEHGINNSKSVITLQKYYIEMTAKGIAREEILHRLQEKGWPEDLIEFIFLECLRVLFCHHLKKPTLSGQS